MLEVPVQESVSGEIEKEFFNENDEELFCIGSIFHSVKVAISKSNQDGLRHYETTFTGVPSRNPFMFPARMDTSLCLVSRPFHPICGVRITLSSV